MKRFLLAFTALIGIGVAAAVADYTATQGAGTTFGSAVQATVHYAKWVLCDLTAPATQCATVSAAGALKIDGSAVTQPVSGTVAVTGSVTANAGTNLNTSALALDATLATTNADLGAPGSTACATDNGSCNLNALTQRNNQRLTTINTTLGTPFQAGGSIGNTSFGATQSGTWTVQPGNTANTTAWLVTGTGGTFPVTATNLSTNVNQINGITPLMGNGSTGTGSPRVTIASDNTPFSVNATLSAETTKVIGTVNQGTSPWVAAATLSAETTKVIGTVRNLGNGGAVLDFAGQNATSPANSYLIGGQFNTTPTTITSGNASPLQLDNAGNLKVNLAAGAGSGGTSSTFGAAFPATGTAVGMTQGGNMVALSGTSGNLNVQCANCSGSGVSTADEAAFTAGTSLFAGSGGFFQTTATNNALTNGQQGLWQMTANRAGFVNLRNAAGAEVGTAGAPVRTDPTGTTTQPENVAQINGITPLMGNGATGTGALRVTVANDNTLPTGWASSVAIASTTAGQTGPLVQCAVTTAAPTYTTAQTDPLSCDVAGSLRTTVVNANANGQATMANSAPVVIASNQSAVPVSGTVAATQSGTWTVQPGNTANSTAWLVTGSGGTFPVTATNLSTNVSQINGVTPLMGNGASGTGAQRVAIANDNTLPTGWASSVAIASTTAGQTGPLAQCAVTTAAPTYTTAQTDPLSCDTAGGLRVNPGTVTVTATNLSTNIAQIAGTTILNGGVAGSQSIGGTVATNVAINSNPVNLGAQAVSSENSAVTTARQVQLVADLVGKLIVLPYSNPENFVSGTITSAMTGTTSTSLVAAPAAGLRNYITQCTVSNSHATVGTDMILQDGSGGTTLYVIPAAPAFGGATLTFPTPLRQPTTATALFIANVTTGSNTKASCSGYKGV